MVCDYKDWTSDRTGETHSKPILQVEIINPETGLTEYPYLIVDSGADKTLIDERFAKMIGLDLSNAEKHKSGQTIWGYGSTRGIKVKEAKIKIRVLEQKRAFTADVGFMPMKGNEIGVLGQQGFFEFHKISFVRSKKKFYIDED